MLRLLSLLLILQGVALPLQPLQAQEPAVQWEMATWSPTRPGGSAQTQATSGEDWAYDVAVSYTNGVADGYIISGYSTFQGVYYPTPAPGCFLCPDNSFEGCSKAKLFKTDLNGKLLWYHDYGQSAAELYAVIQTLDGGYLAVGRTYQRGLTYYSPNHLEGISLNSCSANHTRRNAYVVKIGSDGTVVWEKSYGLLDDPLNVTQALLPQHDAQASDVVEMADGRVRISGYAPIEKPGGGYVTRAFMMELESDGTANWIKAYGDTATASLGRGIDRRGGDYVMVYNQFDDDDYTATGDLSYADIKVIKVDNATGSSGPNTLFDVLVTQSATVHDFGYDVVYNNAGEILVAGTGNHAFLGDWIGRGIFRTTYAQATWQPVNTGLSDTTITALIVTPDDQLLAGTREGGVFLSGNNGLSWQPLNDGLANLHVRALAVGPEGTAYVATEEGLYRSTQPVPTAVEAPATGQVSPVSFQLVGNYPNPFNPTTRLVFEVASAQPVRLAVYDVLGREVAVLVEASVYPVGRHEVVFDGGDLPSGVYFSRLEAGSFTQVRPMMLVK
jgi:hypothetical protein